MVKTEAQRLKILYIYDILKNETDGEKGITVAEIIAKLENYGVYAERKAIYEDISALSNLYGADIIKQKTSNRFEYRLASRDFQLPELKLLVDAVQSSRFITRKKSDELISKLESLTSKHQALELRGQVYVTNRIKTMNETIYYNVDDINKAIITDRKITFDYFEWTPDKKKHLRRNGKRYMASPLALSWVSENYYLIAYDDNADKIKHYRVDKMLKIELLDQKRTLCQFNIEAYTSKVFGMFGGREEKVSLLFDNSLAGAVIDRFGSDVIMIPNGNQFTFTVTAEISPQFFAWISGFGNLAKITHPQTVKNEYIEYINSILNQYETRKSD